MNHTVCIAGQMMRPLNGKLQMTPFALTEPGNVPRVSFRVIKKVIDVFTTFPHQIHSGFFMYVDGKQGSGHEDVIARIYSAQQAGDSTECIMFFYDLKGGGISAMSVIAQDQQDEETVVWHLATVQDTGKWQIGQVPVSAARRIIFQVEKAEGVDAGFAAVDEILCLHVDECLYNPPEAAPGGSTTTSEAPPGGKLPDCDFEVSQCGWTSAVELNNTQFFYFARSQGKFHSDGVSGPQADHYNSSEGSVQFSLFLWTVC